MHSVVAFAALVATTLVGSATALPSFTFKPSKECGYTFKKNCAGTNSTDSNYYCGDSRLGPVYLPKRIPLGTILADYDRLGGLCPGPFLAKWYNATAQSWIYPEQNGFQLDVQNVPIEGQQSLNVGQYIDRFGSEYGAFLAPADAPYSQRSLPPSNLDTPQSDPSYPYNYHVYKVVKPFVVASGPIAAWFGQPGQGTQYQSTLNVLSLIADGSIERVDLSKGSKSRRDFESAIEEAMERRRSL